MAMRSSQPFQQALEPPAQHFMPPSGDLPFSPGINGFRHLPPETQGPPGQPLTSQPGTNAQYMLSRDTMPTPSRTHSRQASTLNTGELEATQTSNSPFQARAGRDVISEKSLSSRIQLDQMTCSPTVNEATQPSRAARNSDDSFYARVGRNVVSEVPVLPNRAESDDITESRPFEREANPSSENPTSYMPQPRKKRQGIQSYAVQEKLVQASKKASAQTEKAPPKEGNSSSVKDPRTPPNKNSNEASYVIETNLDQA
ncbi:MAG: hypothetical protein Q9221_003536 [Calogaya cf. arnoldii]